VHVIVAAVLIGLVLLQHGKGADMGAAFGSGSSGSLFGASGSANFLSRSTAVLAAVFFASSLGLTWFVSTRTGGSSAGANQGIMQNYQAPPAPAKKGDAAAPAAEPTAPKASDSKAGEVPK